MKVAIIGGGLAGVQTAWFLLRDGHQVTLVERHGELAAEASFANGGLLTPSHAAPWNSPGIFQTLLSSLGRQNASIHVKPGTLWQYLGWGRQFVRNSTKRRFFRTIERNFTLARYSQELFDELVEELDLDFFLQRRGTMMVYRSADSFAAARERFTKLKSLGIETELCSPDDLAKLEPALAPARASLSGGAYFSGDRHGDAHGFVQALAGHLQAGGATMMMGTQVTGFIRSGTRLEGIKTDGGDIRADVLVLAGGHWSPDLARTLGVDLPIRPVKGYSITHDLPQWQEGPKIPVVDDDLHVAVTPMGDKIRFVGTAEFCGYDPQVNPACIALVRRSALAIYPQLEPLISGRRAELEWGGHRPMTPDCLPILGKCGFDNLFLNTGHGYLGWTTGTGTSKAVADMISGRQPALAMTDYDLGRF